TTRERIRARRASISASDRARSGTNPLFGGALRDVTQPLERTDLAQPSSHLATQSSSHDPMGDATQPIPSAAALVAAHEAAQRSAANAPTQAIPIVNALDPYATQPIPRGHRESQLRELFREAIPLDEAIAIAIDATRAALPPALA